MADLLPEFESSDSHGTTTTFVGSVGTSAVQIPAVATTVIEEFSIRCTVDQPANTRLEFSIDGTNYARLKVGESREEEPRGGIIKQIWIRAAGSGVTTASYEIFLNRGLL
jgi:hypothetical protein